MAGIIGDALLGGMKGLGEGMAKGAEMDWRDIRDERNARLQGQIQADLETNVRQPFAAEQGRLGREQQSSEGALNRKSQADIHAADAASRERAAAIARRNALSDAMKDLPATIKEYIGVQRERLKALDAAENNPMTDDQTRKGIADQKAALNDLIEQALTTKTIPAKKAAPAAPKPTGERPSLASFFNFDGRQQSNTRPAGPRQLPAQPSAQVNAQPDAQAEPQSAVAVDAARAKLSQAKAGLQQFGLQQRNRDPSGYAAAKRAAEEAERELQAATAQYQSELGQMGAAYSLPPRTR